LFRSSEIGCLERNSVWNWSLFAKLLNFYGLTLILATKAQPEASEELTSLLNTLEDEEAPPVIALSADKTAIINQIMHLFDKTGLSEMELARKRGMPSRNTIRAIKSGKSTTLERAFALLRSMGYCYVIPALRAQDLDTMLPSLETVITDDSVSQPVHWQIEVITIELPALPVQDDSQALAKKLKELGANGWEPIYISPGIGLSQKRIYHVIVKRIML